MLVLLFYLLQLVLLSCPEIVLLVITFILVITLKIKRLHFDSHIFLNYGTVTVSIVLMFSLITNTH